jgi:hypothetical protein
MFAPAEKCLRPMKNGAKRKGKIRNKNLRENN